MSFAVLLAATAAAPLRPVRPHLHMDAARAQAMLDMWKPQVVVGNLVSVTGIRAYAKARISLERHATGVLVREDQTLFVVRCDNRSTVVHAALWRSPRAPRARRFRELRQWHSHHFPEVSLVVAADLDEKDEAAWRASGEEEEA